MSHRYERRRQPEPRNRRRGCLIWLVVLVWVVLLGLLAYRTWIRPQVSQYIGSQIGEQLREQIGGQVGEQIQEGAQGTLPTIVAALPSGELRISEAEANQYFASQGEQLRPIEFGECALCAGRGPGRHRGHEAPPAPHAWAWRSRMAVSSP